MAEATESKIKFWAVLAIICLMVAVAVTLVDLTIKTAILQESNGLRLFIESVRNDSGTIRPDESRADTDPSNNGIVPPNVLDLDSARVETRDVSEGIPSRVAPRPRRNPRNAPKPPEGSA
jgi:hypothetical protein